MKYGCALYVICCVLMLMAGCDNGRQEALKAEVVLQQLREFDRVCDAMSATPATQLTSDQVVGLIGRPDMVTSAQELRGMLQAVAPGQAEFDMARLWNRYRKGTAAGSSSNGIWGAAWQSHKPFLECEAWVYHWYEPIFACYSTYGPFGSSLEVYHSYVVLILQGRALGGQLVDASTPDGSRQKWGKQAGTPGGP